MEHFGHGGGLLVRMLDVNSKNPILNPTEAFSVKILFDNAKIKQ